MPSNHTSIVCKIHQFVNFVGMFTSVVTVINGVVNNFGDRVIFGIRDGGQGSIGCGPSEWASSSASPSAIPEADSRQCFCILLVGMVSHREVRVYQHKHHGRDKSLRIKLDDMTSASPRDL